MKDILDKIGSYNIFNYLLPGIIFSVFISKITSYNLVQEDALVGAFIYYFIGSIVSRIGSLVVEPLLKWLGIISFAPYEQFVHASKKDAKLEILSEANNMYRTICAMLLCISLVFAYDKIAQQVEILRVGEPVVCVLGLMALFVLSYRKQTAYIEKRVSANRE